MKRLTILVLVAFLAFGMATDVFGWSAKQKANKLSTAGSDSIFQDYNDQRSVQIKYDGSETSWRVVQTSYSWVFDAPYGTADASIGTAGTVRVDATAYDTFGELATLISADDNWTMTMLDAPKALNCEYTDWGNQIDTATAYAQADGLTTTFEVSFSSGVAFASGDPTDTSHENYLAINPASGKQITLMKVIVQGDVASAGVVKIIYEDDSASDAVVIAWNEAIANDTDKTITFSIAGGTMGREFDRNDRVIVYVDSDEPQDGAADIQVHYVEW